MVLWERGNHISSSPGLNMNLQILGEILFSNTGGGGQFIYHQVQAKSCTYNILGEILVGNVLGERGNHLSSCLG